MVPYVEISYMTTPRDHTSPALENVPCSSVSGGLRPQCAPVSPLRRRPGVWRRHPHPAHWDLLARLRRSHPVVILQGGGRPASGGGGSSGSHFERNAAAQSKVCQLDLRVEAHQAVARRKVAVHVTRVGKVPEPTRHLHHPAWGWRPAGGGGGSGSHIRVLMASGRRRSSRRRKVRRSVSISSKMRSSGSFSVHTPRSRTMFG